MLGKTTPHIDLRQGPTSNALQVYNATRGSGLSAPQRQVLFALAARASGTLGACWASLATLRWDTGLSLNTIRKAIRSLVSRSLVELQKRVGGTNRIRIVALPHQVDRPPHQEGEDPLSDLVPPPLSDLVPPPTRSGTQLLQDSSEFSERAPIPVPNPETESPDLPPYTHAAEISDLDPAPGLVPAVAGGELEHFDAPPVCEGEHTDPVDQVLSYWSTELAPKLGQDRAAIGKAGRKLREVARTEAPTLLNAMRYLATANTKHAIYLRNTPNVCSLWTVINKRSEYANRWLEHGTQRPLPAAVVEAQQHQGCASDHLVGADFDYGAFLANLFPAEVARAK